jgi:hypothetical protein
MKARLTHLAPLVALALAVVGGKCGWLGFWDGPF